VIGFNAALLHDSLPALTARTDGLYPFLYFFFNFWTPWGIHLPSVKNTVLQLTLVGSIVLSSAEELRAGQL